MTEPDELLRPQPTPWLTGPMPTAALPRAQLEERILNLLSSQNMCVVATAGDGGPLATPVRYVHLGFTVAFTCQDSTPKLRNIAADPRVSVGIFAPLVSEASSRGAQLFGTARVLRAGDADFDRLISVYRWQSDAAERGRPVDRPPSGPLVAVDIEQIVYTEHWLRRSGFAPRQHWRVDHGGASAVSSSEST